MQENFETWIKEGKNPVCFADVDETKWGQYYKGIEIMSLQSALSKYPAVKLFCTQHINNLGGIFRYLKAAGISINHIYNYDSELESNNVYGALSDIYNSLQDELSRKIFWSRLDVSLSYNISGIYKAMVSNENMEWKKNKRTYAEKRYGLSGLWEVLSNNIPEQKDKIFVILVQEDWNEYDWVVERFFAAMKKLEIKIEACLCPYEKELERKTYQGIRCISDEEFRKSFDERSKIVIGFPGWLFETEEIIKRYSEYSDRLYPVADTCLPQYIEPEIFTLSDDEIFVDVGVLDLQNTIDFIEWTKGKFEKIYAFEPDPKLCVKIEKRISGLPKEYSEKIKLVQKALHSDNCIIQLPEEYHGSGVTNGNYIDVEAVTLDDYLEGRRVSFVKMDVEGAEMDVLKGMKYTIQRYKPKMAVCVYHKYQDIYDITAFLKALVPNYKFYLRHYNSNETECVLFCQL